MKLVNNESTISQLPSQHLPQCGEELDLRNQDAAMAVGVELISQQTQGEKGERGGVECSQSGGVLQNRGNLDKAIALITKGS